MLTSLAFSAHPEDKHHPKNWKGATLKVILEDKFIKEAGLTPKSAGWGDVLTYDEKGKIKFFFKHATVHAIEDPLKEGVKEAVTKLALGGLRTVMITGDHPKTAKSIAKQAGILNNLVADGPDSPLYNIHEKRGVLKKSEAVFPKGFASTNPSVVAASQHKLLEKLKCLSQSLLKGGEAAAALTGLNVCERNETWAGARVSSLADLWSTKPVRESLLNLFDERDEETLKRDLNTPSQAALFKDLREKILPRNDYNLLTRHHAGSLGENPPFAQVLELVCGAAAQRRDAASKVEYQAALWHFLEQLEIRCYTVVTNAQLDEATKLIEKLRKGEEQVAAQGGVLVNKQAEILGDYFWGQVVGRALVFARVSPAQKRELVVQFRNRWFSVFPALLDGREPAPKGMLTAEQLGRLREGENVGNDYQLRDADMTLPSLEDDPNSKRFAAVKAAVAFMGDMTNDGPPLKTADVGIAMSKDTEELVRFATLKLRQKFMAHFFQVG